MKKLTACSQEMGRDISDPQPPIGRAIVRVGRIRGGERIGMPSAPGAVLGKQRRRVIARMIVERVEQIAVQPGIVGCQLDGLAMRGDGFVQPAQRL